MLDIICNFYRSFCSIRKNKNSNGWKTSAKIPLEVGRRSGAIMGCNHLSNARCGGYAQQGFDQGALALNLQRNLSRNEPWPSGFCSRPRRRHQSTRPGSAAQHQRLATSYPRQTGSVWRAASLRGCCLCPCLTERMRLWTWTRLARTLSSNKLSHCRRSSASLSTIFPTLSHFCKILSPKASPDLLPISRASSRILRSAFSSFVPVLDKMAATVSHCF